eukprot:798349-Pelagomonas_calceolata.AAC.1
MHCTPQHQNIPAAASGLQLHSWSRASRCPVNIIGFLAAWEMENKSPWSGTKTSCRFWTARVNPYHRTSTNSSKIN